MIDVHRRDRRGDLAPRRTRRQRARSTLAPGESDERSIDFCRELFADVLDGHGSMANNSKWLNFHTVRNAHWHDGNVVLLGDAAHTAHFSIGSGTKLAMEDAIALAWAFKTASAAAGAGEVLQAYEDERRAGVASTQRAAQASLEWFEDISRYIGQEVDRVRLQPADPQPAHHLRQPADARRGVHGRRRPRRSPRTLGHDGRRCGRRCSIRSRCAGWSSPTGSSSRRWTCTRPRTASVGDFHLVHLGSRGIGGAGLVMTEMVCVSAEGRITLGCGGLYRDDHIAGWRRIVEFVHGHGNARIGCQLGHSGRKGATRCCGRARTCRSTTRGS